MITSTMQTGALTVPGMLRHGAGVHGRRAIHSNTESGEVRVSTYTDLDRRARQLAGALTALGVDRADRVATFAWNNTEHVEAYVAVPSMGAVLHTLNIRLPHEELAYIATHAEDRVVICDASLVDMLLTWIGSAPTVEHVVIVGADDEQHRAVMDLGKTSHDYETLLGRAEPVSAWPEIDEFDAAVVCYTSGTTGRPKGVVYSHRSIYLHSLAVSTAAAFGLSDRDRALTIVPMFHANAWGMVHAALLIGCDLVLPDRFMSAPALARLIRTTGVTVSAGVPTIWQELVRFGREGGEVDLSTARAFFAGGSAVSVSLMREFEEQFGIPLIQGSGMTETSPVVTVSHPPLDLAPNSEEYWRRRAAAGQLLPGVDARIVNDDGVVQPADGVAVGEIQYRGPWVTGGYHRSAQPQKFQHGWLRTGDVGSLSTHGVVTISDRTKDLIKSGGEWISSVDLENSLTEHPHVAEAAVIAIPDTKWGERPLAVVVREPNAPFDIGALRTHLSGSVAKWQLPDHWAEIRALPRTGVGKIDKLSLRRSLTDGSLKVTDGRSA